MDDLEKVRMGSCSDKQKMLPRKSIDKKPIRLDMAFPMVHEISD
jgi:hypothetical protein